VFVRDGGTFLRFDRVRQGGDGSITNDNTQLREVPLAPRVLVRGGNLLPPELTIVQLLDLIRSGSLSDVVFVLHYDRNDQVDEIRELLRR
jgi:hypothetical protein